MRFKRQKRIVGVVTLLVFAFGLKATGLAKAHSSEASAEYQQALQVADAFLWCWMEGDSDNVKKLLSPRLTATISDESWFRLYMHGLSNPHHQGFEVCAGQHDGNRYRFRVTLYELATGDKTGDGYTSTIELVRVGETWQVDRLPNSADNQ